MTQVRNRLRKLRLQEISVVDLGADPRAIVEIYKRGMGEMPTDIEKMTDQMLKATEQMTGIQKRLDEETTARKAAEAKVDALTRELAVAKADAARATDDDPDAFLKAMDPAAAKVFKALRDENAKYAKSMAAIDEERDIAKMAQAIGADMPNLPVEVAKFAPILKRAATAMTEEDFAELNRVLKASSAGMGEMLKAVGLPLHRVTKSSTEAEVDAKAQEIAKRDGVTFEKAYTKVLEENPALYRRMNEERSSH